MKLELFSGGGFGVEVWKNLLKFKILILTDVSFCILRIPPLERTFCKIKVFFKFGNYACRDAFNS
jgi:hypothetical protein